MQMNARRLTSTFAMLLCALVGTLALTTPALAVRGHVFGSQFGGKGSGNGQLESPESIAVNESSGRVYVADYANNRVEYFSATGVYEGQFNGSGTLSGEGVAAGHGKQPGEEETGQFSGPASIAVDNSTNPSDPSKGDVYVVDLRLGTQLNVIDKYTANGEYIDQLTGTPSRRFAALHFAGERVRGPGTSVAVDTTGRLWVTFRDENEIRSYVAGFDDGVQNGFLSEPGEVRGNAFSEGLAVDSRDNLYFRYSEAGPSAVEKFTAAELDRAEILNREVGDRDVGGEGAEWPAVESSSGDVYLGQGKRVSRFTSEGLLLERLGEGHLTMAAGIAVDSASGTVYVVDFATDTVELYALEEPGIATVGREAESEVSSDSVTLAGEINPRGAAVEYHFEYGQCANSTACSTSGYEASIPVPDGQLGANFESFAKSVHLQGLLPDTAYHFHLVAHNQEFGTAVGEERMFITQSGGGPLVLPDGRAWELVTPPSAHGAQFFPIEETGLEQAAAEGGGFAYLASYPTEPDPQGDGLLVQALASRGPAGWSSVDVAMSHSKPVGAFGGAGQEYRFFSEDLGSAVAESPGPFSRPESEGLSEAFPEPTERTPYVRHDTTCAQTPATCYAPVLTSTLGEGDVLPDKKFGGISAEAFGLATFVGATADVSHVVVSSSVELTEALPAGALPAPDGGLYEWTESSPVTERLRLVSVLPEGEGGGAATGFEFGRHGVSRHAISGDGSRVFFTAFAPGQAWKHLYMRDTVRGETIRLDVAEGGSAANQPEAFFQSASADGSEVFFTDLSALTKDAGTGGVNFDLYRCDIVEVEEKGGRRLKCDLSDLTPVPGNGQPGAGEGASVEGNIPGASENDGGYVYFVANGVQAKGAGPGDCAKSTLLPGETCNLYVSHEGVTNFIATLSSDDAPDWADTFAEPLKDMTSRVSPDGVWLAFMSDRELTGYDNHDAKSGMPDEEVYLYNAQTKRLVCASCNPTGARPDGEKYGKLTTGNGGLVGGDRVWNEGQWLAANVPGWTPYALNRALYQSRYLSDSGRLFFNSSDGLVPQDTNSNEDVYEYEPTGVGPETAACAETTATFVPSAGGCVGLISSGVGFGESAFLDASANGSDVFFLTAEKLAPQDIGTGLDIYDAHECTAASPCASPPAAATPECVSAASCRAAPAGQPSLFGAPASATFSGAGNLASPGLVSAVAKHPQAKKKPKAKKKAKKGKSKSTRRKSLGRTTAHRSVGVRGTGHSTKGRR
jgi:hypothetical protein